MRAPLMLLIVLLPMTVSAQTTHPVGSRQNPKEITSADRGPDLDPKQFATQPFRGEQYFPINAALGDAYTRVDVDKSDDSASSWAKFETAVNDLG